MAKQILRFEPIHSGQAFAAKWRHNYRIGPVKNADINLRDQNKILVNSEYTYDKFFQKRIKETPYYDDHAIKKNATRGFEVMMSYGLKNLPPDFSIDKWADTSIEWLKSEFGQENIAGAVLHMDEGVPHIHAVVIPIKDGILKATAYIPDRQAMREVHNRYYNYTKELGLERGNSCKLIEHEKTGKFYNNIDMALEKNLPSPEAGESLEEYAARANEFYKNQMLRNLGKDYQVNQLKKENEALERANSTIEERTKATYEEQLDEILLQIGSIPKAKQAIEFHEKLENVFRYTLAVDQEKAENFLQDLKDMKLAYQEAEMILTPTKEEPELLQSELL